MIAKLQQQILDELHTVCELSSDVRFGQMLANLTFLTEDSSGQSIWDVDDETLLRLVASHRADLQKRQSSPNEQSRSAAAR